MISAANACAIQLMPWAPWVRSVIIVGGLLASIVECRAKRRRNRQIDHVANAYNRHRLNNRACAGAGRSHLTTCHTRPDNDPMKKLTLSALAFATITNGAVAADAPNTVHASLELTKNGQPVSMVELAMIEGRKTPYSSLSTRSYVAECTPDRTGTMIAKRASVTTGMDVDVTPIHVSNEGAMLAVEFNFLELEGMKSAQVKGCAIEIPTTHTLGNSATVQVKPGQTVELPSFGGSDKYVLVIRSL